MLKRIESADNAKLRLVRRLQTSRKYRDSEGLFVIEGMNLINEAMERNADIDFVLCSDDFSAADAIDKRGLNVYVMQRRLFDRISDAQNGVGVIAVVSGSRHVMEDLKAEIKPDDNILVLDRLQDPGNMGTVIRTAAASGYKAVIAIKGTADVYSPKVLRATAGTIFDIPIVYVNGEDELTELIRELGKKITVTAPARGVPYYEADLSKGTALVIGNEGNGISGSLIERADEIVTIPMSSGIESLNAAVSAGILMYETVRKRRP